MARSKEKTLQGATRALFGRFWGQAAANDTNSPSLPWDWAYDNTAQRRWRNGADTDDVRALSVNSSDLLELGQEGIIPCRKTVRFNVGPAANLTSRHFFIADQGYRIVSITEIHKTAETTAATLTMYVEKLASGVAAGSGSTVMSGTFNGKATANTLQTGTLYEPNTGDSDDPLIHLIAGDRLGIVFSTTATELVGVDVEVVLAPRATGTAAVYTSANGAINTDQAFYVANRDCIVTRVDYVSGTAGSATCNLQVVKDTSTNAPGAGTDMLTNNTNSGFDGQGTANIIQNGTLTATVATLRLAPGDRLSVDYSGTTTALAAVVVVVTLQYLEKRVDVSYAVSVNADLQDMEFFTADRGYEILCVSEVHSVAGTDGGSVNLQVTRDKATDAPGAGTDLLVLNSSAGFNLKGTANTVQIAQTGSATQGFVDPRFNFLMAGDRLSLDFAGTLTTLAGVVVTVSLRPC